MLRRGRRFAYGAVLSWMGVWLAGCGSEDAIAPIDGGVPDAQPDGPVVDAGPLPGPCDPGELLLGDGSCEPAGVPPEACGPGFEPDGERGCAPVLPAAPCPVGTMATPGETECREVAPCGTEPWEGIPIDGTTQHVDGSYGGGGSDGSASQPWTTIQDGVDAAEPGAVIAVAAGSYGEDVWIDQTPVKIWGTCPGQVEIAGASGIFPVVYVVDAASTELHQLAITGPGYGVEIHESVDVLIDQVWIHHTGDVGLQVTAYGGDGSVDLQRSLIEQTVLSGADVWAGAELRVADSVIRDCQADEGVFGRGLSARSSFGDLTPTRLEVRRSLLERNRENTVQAFGADLLIEDTVIRDTYPIDGEQLDGSGIVVAHDLALDRLPTFELRRSTVDRNQTCGVCVIDAETTVEHVTVVDTAPQALDGRFGYGLAVGSEAPLGADRPSVTIQASTVRGSSSMGVVLAGVDAVVEGLLVQHTASEEASGMLGRGLVVQIALPTGVGCRAAIAGTRIEASHEVGLLVLGSEATLDSVVISGTEARPSDGLLGRGLIVQLSHETQALSTVTMRHSLVEDSSEVGFYAAGADVVVEDSVVRRSRRRLADEAFGDGVVASALPLGQGNALTSLRLERCLIGHNDRAGIANFGAQVVLGTSQLDCNAIALNGETYLGTPDQFEDLGSNLCGCESELTVCKSLSTGLSPPEPFGP